MKKYELTDDSITLIGRKLFRIRAIRSFSNVAAGDLGGYVEKEENLSHYNDAWIYGDARISDNARVSGDARICDNARIFGNARVSGDARISGNARISDKAHISGNARICGNACIFGDARICDNAWISDYACIYDNAHIYVNAYICSNARIYGNACISGNAHIYGDARISGNARISGDADYLYLKGLGSENRNTTFFKCKDGHMHVSCGCFSGTMQEFENKVKKTHNDSKYAKEYLACIELVKIHFEEEKK